ncbi:MAG TPA: hypothetical protein VGL02_24290 [Streptomyces sp.]
MSPKNGSDPAPALPRRRSRRTATSRRSFAGRAEEDGRARAVLAKAVDHLHGADLSLLYVGSGASAMLHRLGHGIRLRPGVLELPTAFDADLDLGERALRIQAVALSPRVTLAEPADDQLTLRIPAGAPPTPEPGQLRALSTLLGPGRAEALDVIVTSGGVTGRQLASLLGVSSAAASRYAAALRHAGLIRTQRMGQAVQHIATPLGYHLAQPRAADWRP